MLVGFFFLYTPGKTLPGFHLCYWTSVGTEKKLPISVCAWELSLFIKSLTSDFILLFLFKVLWIWVGSAVTKDRWLSEAFCYNSNLSYSSTFDQSWRFFDVLSRRSTRCARLPVKRESNFLCLFQWVCPNEQTHHQEASCMCSVTWEKVWSIRVSRVHQERIPHDPRKS